MGTSLVVQWLRICLPLQGTWVRPLVQEDPSGKISLCTTTTEPTYWNYQSLHPLAAVVCNKRSHLNEKPMNSNWRLASTYCI